MAEPKKFKLTVPAGEIHLTGEPSRPLWKHKLMETPLAGIRCLYPCPCCPPPIPRLS
jgi:hypothetical protein